jgi:CubicO group peptidase (beta-lactamase class C family)
VDAGTTRLRADVETRLWPLLEAVVGTHEVAGLAVAVVREGEVVAQGFGVRDLRTGEPVTGETMFHLASVSKPFVATAVVSLAVPRDGVAPELDLDAPVVDRIPELTLADGREGEIAARGLLSHTSGLPDVSDYGWHDPQLGDDALSAFARSLSDWRLRTGPGAAYSYSNAGFELLGLLLSRVTGTTFEDAVRRVVLDPLGMRTSTFLRAEVPARLAASPHVGRPLTVPGDAYPYSRRHAPSSTLHSHVDDMGRWMLALLEPSHLDPAVLEQMWQPVVPVGDPPWEEDAGLGWAVGTYLGHRAVSHSGADPGFGSRLVLLPGRRTGVVVLANSNTVPTWAVVEAALDVALDDPVGDGVSALRSEVARLAAPAGRATPDLDDDDLEKAVWGAIELHRTDLAWPLLQVWADVRPESSVLQEMTEWAHRVDRDRT